MVATSKGAVRRLRAAFSAYGSLAQVVDYVWIANLALLLAGIALWIPCW
jgi:hypothetical protein